MNEGLEYAVAAVVDGKVSAQMEATPVRAYAYEELERFRAFTSAGGGNPEDLFVAARPVPVWTADAAGDAT